jgi:hypothetical protein
MISNLKIEELEGIVMVAILGSSEDSFEELARIILRIKGSGMKDEIILKAEKKLRELQETKTEKDFLLSSLRAAMLRRG